MSGLNHMCVCFNTFWKSASKRRKIAVYVVIYAAIFSITALIVYSPFLLERRSMVWSNGGTDGHYQHWPALIYAGKWWRELIRNLLKGHFTFKMFDISVGMGADVIGTLNFYGFGDPLNWLSMMVPAAYSEYLYCFLCVLRVFLAGLAFSYLCVYFKRPISHTLIGSMIYCFGGFAIMSSVVDPYFMNPMIQLPLLLVGIDKSLKRKSAGTLIFSCAYSAMCGFYMFYMLTVLSVIFAAVRFFDIYENNRLYAFGSAVLRVGAIYLLGIGLAAFFFVPSCVSYFMCSRGSDALPTQTLLYSAEWYKRNFLILFSPAGDSSEWNYQAFAAIVLFALVLLFGNGKNRTLKILTYIAFALYFFPVGGKIMNGFHYASNRWTFGLLLLVAYVTVQEMPELLKMTVREVKLCVFICVIWLGIIMTAKMTGATAYIWVGAVFSVVSLMTLIMVHPSAINCFLNNKGYSAIAKWYFSRFLCLVLVIVNVGVYGIYFFGSDYGNFVGEFPEIGILSSTLEDHAIKKVQNHLGSNPSGRADFSAKSSFRNFGMVYQVPTIPFYWSVTNKYVSEFWQKIENPALRGSFNLHNSDWRTIPLTLLSGKYFGTAKKEYLPYGYSEIEIIDDLPIHENNYALPWGYTYEKAGTYEELDVLNGLQKQEYMIQAVALEEGGFNDEKTDNILVSEQLDYDYQCDGCIWENGIINVKEANATVMLTFDMPEFVEGYVRLSGFRTDTKSFNISVQCDKVSKSANINPPTYLRYYEHENYLFSLGYSDNKRTTCTITFPTKGTYALGDIELYALPMDHYPEQVEALREEPLENIQWGTNRLTGTVDLSKDKILCVSVPYSKGWSATVDGEKAEILRGNYMFMCLPLTAGHHDIEFSYCSPGMKPGIVVSLASLCIVVGMLVHDRRKRKAVREKQ